MADVFAWSSYRLAPEHPYPVPFDDCVRATVHFLQHAAEMDIDPARIAIGGIALFSAFKNTFNTSITVLPSVSSSTKNVHL